MAPRPPVSSFVSTPRIPTSSEPVPETLVPTFEFDDRSATAAHLIDHGDAAALFPIAQHDLLAANLVKRTDSSFAPGQGAKAPDTFNNNGFFALFALLGAAMVLAALWFFFWAKNGGFQFREGDWDDYKSTVLRRKGPDGKTLSNATKSTKLGGGTIAGTQRYAWQKNMAHSVVGRDEKGRKGVLGKRGWANSHSITYSDDFTDSLASRTVTDEMTELRSEPDMGHHSKRYRDRDVHQYKRERPARVGGLNRVADSSHYDYTNSDRSDVMTETVLTESSDQPMIPKASDKHKEKERAERKARAEAAKMERRWKREAEEAAAALAAESSRPRPPPAHIRKSSSPSKQPTSAYKPRRDRASSRTASPKKRDFSYTAGPESETLSTAYTESPSQRTASYYDEYRPRASENPRYSEEYGRAKRSTRASSPRKKQGGGGGAARSGGYRRGGVDSDLE